MSNDLLKKHNVLLHVSATGAGPALFASLWEECGASKYLVGFEAPYARAQLETFRGFAPAGETFASRGTALDMAMESYIRAAEAQAADGLKGEPMGLGVSARVASDREPLGELRAHIAIVYGDRVVHSEIALGRVLRIGRDAREAHDAWISGRALTLIERLLSGKGYLPEADAAADARERFWRRPFFDTDGRRQKPLHNAPGGLYLPATLNPIHDGHRALAAAAELQVKGDRVRYLVSADPPHKEPLTLQEMLRKVGMLRAEGTRRAVEFTRWEPLFLDKARARPGSRFAIGGDAMQEILDSKYYSETNSALEEFERLGTHFFVMSRTVRPGVTHGFNELFVPYSGRHVFHWLPGLVDASSTEIREARG